MKKTLVKIGLVAGIATTSLLGFTYEIKQGWQQLGAIKDFDTLSTFDDPNNCVEYLWHYDLDEPIEADKWKLHISDGKIYNYCGKTFNSLDKGDGFWLKASRECNITVEDPNNCDSGFPTPPSLNGSTCDTNITNPDNNITANIDVISTNTGYGEGNISKLIFNDKNGKFEGKLTDGYFYNEYSNCIIKINKPFKLWTSLTNDSTAIKYNGKLKITNINTHQSFLSKPYPDSIEVNDYYLMTEVLPAGTYKFEKASTLMSEYHYRVDDGWFFEIVQ